MCVAFNSAFMKGNKLGMLKCWSQVIEHHQGLDLSFLDERESKEEPSDGVAALDSLVEVVPSLASEATTTKPITIEPITTKPLVKNEATLSDPTTVAKPPIAIDSKKVGN